MPESLELSGQSGQVHRCASKGEANFASHYCAFKRGQTMISFFHGEKISAKEGHGPILLNTPLEKKTSTQPPTKAAMFVFVCSDIS